MEPQEKYQMMDVLLAIKQELQDSREERKNQQQVHVHVSHRVETVLLSCAAALIALAGFWAVVQPPKMHAQCVEASR